MSVGLWGCGGVGVVCPLSPQALTEHALGASMGQASAQWEREKTLVF